MPKLLKELRLRGRQFQAPVPYAHYALDNAHMQEVDEAEEPRWCTEWNRDEQLYSPTIGSSESEDDNNNGSEKDKQQLEEE